MKVVWFVLKLVPTLIIASCILTDIQGTAWVRGVTGDSTPFFLTLAGSVAIVFWTYSVVWRPLAPKAEK